MKIRRNDSKIRTFLKNNRIMLTQFAVIGVALMTSDTTFASSVQDSGSFGVISKPLEAVGSTLTGPVAKAVGTVGIAAACLATGLNMEQQMMKRGIQLAGGVAGAIGATSLLADATSASGLLF